jgi:hypothetical protein
MALHQSIPFIGFGIMDNSVLILAGEAIDIELGTILNISLCGVAFGTVFATYLERVYNRHVPTVILLVGKKGA